MTDPTRRRRARRRIARALPGAAILLLGALAACPAARAADTAFRIAVDLTGVDAATLRNPSYAEVQFNPASGSSLAASVALSNFIGSGGTALGSSFEREGGATGSFASGTVANSGVLNRLNQDVTVSLTSTFTIDVTFSGAALAGGAADGSTFAFALFQDRANRTPYANSAPDGQSLLTIDLNPDGSLTPAAYNPSGPGPRVTVTPLAPAVVPEAGTLPLLAAAGLPVLLGIGVARRRRAAACLVTA